MAASEQDYMAAVSAPGNVGRHEGNASPLTGGVQPYAVFDDADGANPHIAIGSNVEVVKFSTLDSDC